MLMILLSFRENGLKIKEGGFSKIRVGGKTYPTPLMRMSGQILLLPGYKSPVVLVYLLIVSIRLEDRSLKPLRFRPFQG